MDRGCTAGIEEAGAEAKVDAELGEPAARPDPMREKGKDQGGEDCRGGTPGGEAEPVRSRAPGDERGQGHGEQFIKQRELGVGRSCREAGEEVRAFAKPVPRLAGEVKNVAGAVGQAGEGCSHENKNDGGDREDGNVSQKRLGGGTGAAETRIDQRHTCNGQRGNNQQDERKHEDGFREGRNNDGELIHQLASPRGSMCPRTATARPRASTARPQRTKAVREAGPGKSTSAARHRKKPAGMTSNPAYFMRFPFQALDDGIRPTGPGLGADPQCLCFVTEDNRLECLYEF